MEKEKQLERRDQKLVEVLDKDVFSVEQIPRSACYYLHMTFYENLESILEKGLRPPNEIVGNREEYPDVKMQGGSATHYDEISFAYGRVFSTIYQLMGEGTWDTGLLVRTSKIYYQPKREGEFRRRVYLIENEAWADEALDFTTEEDDLVGLVAISNRLEKEQLSKIMNLARDEQVPLFGIKKGVQVLYTPLSGLGEIIDITEEDRTDLNVKSLTEKVVSEASNPELAKRLILGKAFRYRNSINDLQEELEWDVNPNTIADLYVQDNTLPDIKGLTNKEIAMFVSRYDSLKKEQKYNRKVKYDVFNSMGENFLEEVLSRVDNDPSLRETLEMAIEFIESGWGERTKALMKLGRFEDAYQDSVGKSSQESHSSEDIFRVKCYLKKAERMNTLQKAYSVIRQREGLIEQLEVMPCQLKELDRITYHTDENRRFFIKLDEQQQLNRYYEYNSDSLGLLEYLAKCCQTDKEAEFIDERIQEMKEGIRENGEKEEKMEQVLEKAKKKEEGTLFEDKKETLQRLYSRYQKRWSDVVREADFAKWTLQHHTKEIEQIIEENIQNGQPE